MEFLNFHNQSESKREKWIGYLYLATVFLFVFRLFAQLSCFQLGAWTLYGFTMANALVCFIIILLLFPDFSKWEKIIWIGLIASVFISWLTHFTGLEYICNTAIFLSVLTTLPKIEWKNIHAEILFYIFSAYLVFVLIFVNRSIYDTGTLIFMNPNGVCFILVLYQFILVAYARAQRKRLLEILLYLIAGGVIFFQIQFGGRASLLGTGILAIYCIFQKFVDKRSEKQIRWIIWSISFFSILFAVFYAVVLYGILGDDIFILGKDLFTGREIIWLDAFKALRYKWPIGIGQTLMSIPINEVEGPTNLHNVMMGYLTHFGAFSAIFYAILLGLLTATIGKAKRKTTVIFLIVMSVMGYFDTVLFSTGNVLYLPIALILIYHFDTRERSK